MLVFLEVKNNFLFCGSYLYCEVLTSYLNINEVFVLICMLVNVNLQGNCAEENYCRKEPAYKLKMSVEITTGIVMNF